MKKYYCFSIKSIPTSLLIFLTIILVNFSITNAIPSYVYHICSNETTFTPNSNFQSNLNLLLSILSTNASVSGGFYNATVGRTSNSTVYGLFQCRGDVTTATCQECVSYATTYVVRPEICPIEKVVIIWFDECILHYSNTSFFSTIVEVPTVSLLNTVDIDEVYRADFIILVIPTLNNAKVLATRNWPGRRNFATQESRFSENQTLYTLVQCTSDLSSSACGTCLDDAIGQIASCCTQKRGGRVLFPSCFVRYEVYSFYNLETPAPPDSVGPPDLPPDSVAPPDLPTDKGNKGISTVQIIFIVVSIVLFLLIIGCLFLWRSRVTKNYTPVREYSGSNEISTVESLRFDFPTIKDATNNFSKDNKLGRGGFGEVYKGRLPDGQHVAVKRLYKHSVQGSEEFQNEVMLVAKLQHKNLVRLFGFCMEGEEKILIFEFVKNKSLDSFLYDPEKQGQLDWLRRYQIIGGIARGILYLHEDSRLKIIHRDIKAGNILLDDDLSPKISDFGMARIVRMDQTEENTRRVVGTYGYMSPEYAMHGLFSLKSDVYSFGVLVLEIISGKKINKYLSDCAEDLLSYAWKLWKCGKPLELVDPTLRDSYSSNEVLRCIQIGLLSVQEDPADRPSMASIVHTLNSYSVALPLPKQPAFFIGSRYRDIPENEMKADDQSTSMSNKQHSINGASITELGPR